MITVMDRTLNNHKILFFKFEMDDIIYKVRWKLTNGLRSSNGMQ